MDIFIVIILIIVALIINIAVIKAIIRNAIKSAITDNDFKNTSLMNESVKQSRLLGEIAIKHGVDIEVVNKILIEND